MTDYQIKTARRRLVLGISNVGFWVLASLGCLAWFAAPGAAAISPTYLVGSMLVAVGVQACFDGVGGAFLIPAPLVEFGVFLRRWVRGVAAHTTLLCAVGGLSYWSFRLTEGFCVGVVASSLGLFLFRRQILRLVSGLPARPFLSAGPACWSADSSDPSFTGGTCGMGSTAMILLPGPWTSDLNAAELQTVIQRRVWEIKNNLPARSFLFALSWNLAGCRVGSLLLELPNRLPESAMLLQGCWMTVWGFLGLLILPTVSRSSVFGADRATAAQGFDSIAWIQRFPKMTGEDGNPKTLLQRVFYPIPSAQERLDCLERSPVLPIFGNVARTNLFLSLATLTFLGRCVHCNVGRPELWVFPPSD